MPNEITLSGPFGLLMLAIQERLTAQVPDLAHIDVDMSQLFYEEPQVAWPACLVDFENFSFKNRGDGSQDAEGVVLISLAVRPYSKTTASTPLLWRQKGLNYFDLEFKTNEALHGWHPDDEKYGPFFSTLTRLSEGTEKRTIKSFHVRELRYAITIEDFSTQKLYDFVAATPEIASMFI